MDKTHFHTIISLQVKVIYALLSALGLFVIAVLDFYEQQQRLAAIAAGFALGLVLWAGYMLASRHRRYSVIPERILVLLLLVFTLFGMHEEPRVVHWVYFVPIYTYFLIPFRWANIALVMYTLVLVVVVLKHFGLELRWQVLFTYASCLVFSLMYALINERNNQRLQKIINTDPVTHVYNQHQLERDLNKEMIRADRQHSQLQLMMVATPESWQALKGDDYEQCLSQFSHQMRKCLRQYDTCYRLNSDNFMILMPQTERDEAEGLTRELERQFKLKAETHHTSEVLLHIETYQPEDDLSILMARLAQGLNNAR